MNNINYVSLGEKIKSTRKERGYTQEKLAEICDISTGFLGHIERGTRKLSLDTLFCIATVLNVSIDYLLIDSANKSDNFLEQMDSVARSLNILMKCNKKDFLYLPFSLYRYSYRKSCTFCPILIYFQHSVVIHIDR